MSAGGYIWVCTSTVGMLGDFLKMLVCSGFRALAIHLWLSDVSKSRIVPEQTGFSSLFDTAPVAAANPNLSKLFFLNSQLIIPRIYGLSFYFTPPSSYM